MIGLYLPEGVRSRLRAGEGGQAFIEYVLLLTAIAITVSALAAAWTSLGTTITTLMTNVANAVTSA